jgi:hypothetical protein
MKIFTPKTMFVLALGLASFASAAQASQIVAFHVNGLGIKSSGFFTIIPNVSPADPNPLCGTSGNNPCRSDPPGAYRITNVTGTFTDATAGIFNAAITGLVPTNPANERDPVFDPLVPASLSFVPSGLSYNNLFFPNGSPIDCAFPFFGTFLDVFGTAFNIAGGYTVDFWGDGNMGPGGALTYGVGVDLGANTIDYQFAGVGATVPEPLTLSLFGMGLAGAAAMRRRRKQRV